MMHDVLELCNNASCAYNQHIKYMLETTTYLSARSLYFDCRNCAYVDVYATFPDWIKMPWAAGLTMEVGNNSEKID